MQNKHFHFAFNFLCVFDLSFKKQKKTTKQTEKQKNQHRQDRCTAGRPSGGKLLGTEAAWKRQTEKKNEVKSVHDKHRRWQSETDVGAS